MPSGQQKRERVDRAMRKLRTLTSRASGKSDTIRQDGIVLRLTGRIGPLGEISAQRVESALRRYPNAPVELIIESPGGRTREAEKIGDLLDRHKGHVVGTVNRYC